MQYTASIASYSVSIYPKLDRESSCATQLGDSHTKRDFQIDILRTN